MRRVIAGLLAIFFLLATGCSDKKSVPSGILPPEKMENVLWDIIQADQYTADLAKDSSAHIADLKTERLRLYDQVFRLHDVSRDKFRKSYQYYTDHPELSQDLFDSLLVRGNRLRSEQYSHPITRPVISTPAPASRDTLHKLPQHFPLGSPFNHPGGATPNHPGLTPKHPAPIPPGKRPSFLPPADPKAV
jgi:hypothetical protein